MDKELAEKLDVLTEAISELDRIIALHTEAVDEQAAAIRDLCRLLREQREWQPITPTVAKIDGEPGATHRSPRSYKLPKNFKPFLTEEEMKALEAKHGKQLAPGVGPAWKELPPNHGKQYDSLLDMFEGEEEVPDG